MNKNVSIVVRQGIAITGPLLWERLVARAREARTSIRRFPGSVIHWGTVINDNDQPQVYCLKQGWFGGYVFEPVVY